MQANPFTVKVEEDFVPSQPFMTVGCTACSSVVSFAVVSFAVVFAVVFVVVFTVVFAVVFAVVPFALVGLLVGGQDGISSKKGHV